MEHTKKLYPHFYDKTDDSNFTKHLKIVGKPQQDIRHKLKSIEWSRILEKPLQVWKEQTKPYIYDMHFKVIVPNIKEVNIYKNPIINDDEEVIGFEELCSTEQFTYEQNRKLYEKVLYDLSSNDIIPKDNYLLEIFTWDDYHFLKGYPENDFTVKEDNILDYRYNETFLNINLETISYTKYLTFRVHKDNIKQITIYKNNNRIFQQNFDYDNISTTSSTKFSYIYFDESITNENTYLQEEFSDYYEIEDEDANNIKQYFVDTKKDEYVFRLPLSDDDFEDGVVKDIYDLEVITFENRYRCRQDFDKTYSKRYCGYDKQPNDCFDHDYSLDMIGRLLNIHRFRFYKVYNDDYYYNTYPTFYDRATEDDYHYMKRIQFYISNYNHIVFPVLEFWKYYHTMTTVKSRKRIVGEMDYAYFRTLDSDDYICSDDVVLDEEDFDDETIIEYSVNKATLLKGSSSYVNLGDGWYEATIVKDVYVVPSTDYHLKYTISENSENVTIRLICYNRQKTELRTIPITLKNEEYAENTVDTTITIPDDTVSIKLILESNSSFEFEKVSFERMKVVNFDNYYMGTDTDYNSNVYELFANYEDFPKNLRIGGDRFDILFKRSLPITKSGFFFVDVNEEQHNNIEIDTDLELYAYNILESNDRTANITKNNSYESTVSYCAKGNKNYDLNYFVKSLDDSPIYEPNYDDVLFDSDDAFVTVFNDDGTTKSHNDNWVKYNPNNITITRGEEYTSVTGSNYRYGVPISNDCKIKVETRKTTSSTGNLLTIWTYSSNPLSASQLLLFSVTEMGMTQGTFANIEMTVTPTTVTVKNLDNDTTITKEYSTSNNLIFNFWGTTFDYKNFKVTEVDKTKFTTGSAPVIMTPNDNAITLTYVSGLYIVNANKDGGTEFDYTGDFSVDFDIVGTPNNVTLQIYENNSTNYYAKSLNQIGALKPCHIKIIKIGTKIYTFVDGVENVGQRFNSSLTGNCRFAFRCGTSGSFTFKNLVISPLGYSQIINDDQLVSTTVTYYDSKNNEINSDDMEQKIYADQKTHITHNFTTPSKTSYFTINISSNIDTEITEIRLSRLDKLRDEEMY